MKKLINIAFIYAFFALASGVFFREFTKFYSFTGDTNLSLLHVHMLVLGTVIYLVLALFSINTDLLEVKKFKLFNILYNIGLVSMFIMIFTKGILEVMNVTMSKALTASISGISGLSHIILTMAFVLLFMIMKNLKVAK